jgi:hypothetical protein
MPPKTNLVQIINPENILKVLIMVFLSGLICAINITDILDLPFKAEREKRQRELEKEVEAYNTNKVRKLRAKEEAAKATEAAEAAQSKAPIVERKETKQERKRRELNEKQEKLRQKELKKQNKANQPTKAWYQFWGGGNNTKADKLKKNIARLYNCYVLSQNQHGGDIIDNKLSSQIKKRLDKKIAELKDLEGGFSNDEIRKIHETLINRLTNKLDEDIDIYYSRKIPINNIEIPILIPKDITKDIIKHFIKLLIPQIDIKKIFEIVETSQKGGGDNRLSFQIKNNIDKKKHLDDLEGGTLKNPKFDWEYFTQYRYDCENKGFNTENDVKNVLINGLYEILFYMNVQEIIWNARIQIKKYMGDFSEFFNDVKNLPQNFLEGVGNSFANTRAAIENINLSKGNEHGEYRSWIPGTNTWGYSSVSHATNSNKFY